MDRSNLYLVKLFYFSRSLFFIVLLFLAASLSANFIFRSEQTPFYKWDLYSEKLSPQSQYSFLEVRYNGDHLLTFPHTWQEPVKLFFTNTLDYYITIKRNNDTDPYKNYVVNDWSVRHSFFKKIIPGDKLYNGTGEISNFPAWYKRYLEQYVKVAVTAIDIYEKKVIYSADGDVTEVSSSLICKLL